MKKKTLISYLFLVTLASCNTNSDNKADDQRSAIANDCGMPSSNGRPCRLSQVTLLGEANAYTDKEVQMVSYLALDKGRLVIYPSREFFISGDRLSSIELSGQYETLKEMSHRFAFQYIHIRGTFAKDSDIQGSESRFGKLNNAIINGPAMPGIEDRSNLDPDIVVDSDES